MSYAIPDHWWAGYHTLRRLHDQLAAIGDTAAAAEVAQAQASYNDMMQLAGVLYTATLGFPLYMTPYQRDNLTKFLAAVTTHPDTTMGTWDTGDWWGEVLYKIQGIGGQAERGNAHRSDPPSGT